MRFPVLKANCESNNCDLCWSSSRPHPHNGLLLVKRVQTIASQSADGGVESVVRGHHVYKRIWTPHAGEQLLLKCEESSDIDPRAVAIVKDGVVVGHTCHGRQPELCGSS